MNSEKWFKAAGYLRLVFLRLTGELAVIVLGPVLPPARADCLIPSCAISDRAAARAANLP